MKTIVENWHLFIFFFDLFHLFSSFCSNFKPNTISRPTPGASADAPNTWRPFPYIYARPPDRHVRTQPTDPKYRSVYDMYISMSMAGPNQWEKMLKGEKYWRGKSIEGEKVLKGQKDWRGRNVEGGKILKGEKCWRGKNVEGRKML